MARTNCRMEPRSILVPRAVRMARAAVPDLPLQARHKRGAPRRAAPEVPRDESVTAVHSAAGRHHPSDGRRPPCGLGRFPAITHLGVAASRLPHDQVQTFYPGASPEVMASSVTAPLERQFGQTPGLNQMTSTSSFGSSMITLQFNLDLNIDVAEQQVQAAINSASNLLPQGLPNPPIYSKINPADAPILTLALSSKSLPLSKVEDLADTTLAQKISQLSGVGLVSISGGQRPAVRIQAN